MALTENKPDQIPFFRTSVHLPKLKRRRLRSGFDRNDQRP